MDKFRIIEFFSNGELFKKTSQVNLRNDETEFRFECKRLDRNGRRRHYMFRCKRRKMEVGYVNYFVEDIQEEFLACKIYNIKYLKDSVFS